MCVSHSGHADHLLFRISLDDGLLHHCGEDEGVLAKGEPGSRQGEGGRREGGGKDEGMEESCGEDTITGGEGRL